MADAYIKRTTLFKIPKEEDIEAVLRQYEIVRATARKVRSLDSSRPCELVN